MYRVKVEHPTSGTMWWDGGSWIGARSLAKRFHQVEEAEEVADEEPYLFGVTVEPEVVET